MADKETKETVIGPETRISGEVRGEEDLVVRGRIDGKIHLTQTLTIEDGGIVQADVEVKALVISGVLVGSVTASESVRLTSKARVIGDITAPRFIMDGGATYRGRVEMGEGGTARASSRRTETDRPASSERSTPKMTAPARASSSVAPGSLRAPSAPPRVAGGNAPRIPLMPRPDLASGSAAPAWAKKKLKRRN